MSKKIKALSLFSGGLDSQLAVKVLQQAGIEVVGIIFTTPFFGADKAKTTADQLGLKLIVKDITKEHLKMMKNPAHGFGKNMNPCIDCHGLMLRIARKEMKKIKADFVATGEVLGQRPMSQNVQALKIVGKISGLDGLLVRPLSGKLLPVTKVEERGLVNKNDLLAIQGRGRKPQLTLAKKFQIKDYPTPAGGCLLTDPDFSQRLKKLFITNIKYSPNDIELLKYGRHFYQNKSRIIVGRNEFDNEQLLRLGQKGETFLELKDYPGPLVLIRGKKDLVDLEFAKKLAIKYNNKVNKLEIKNLIYKVWQK